MFVAIIVESARTDTKVRVLTPFATAVEKFIVEDAQPMF